MSSINVALTSFSLDQVNKNINAGFSIGGDMNGSISVYLGLNTVDDTTSMNDLRLDVERALTTAAEAING